ncbi:hypothetical protein EDD76_108144 [Kineothrix alysoides]|uniref:Uncharacterized protein n=1 Tax=Kineothrix alysoides TaxID=1469948 RepID=A0A4R1QUG6_9FIRM|nr:hypothetical protein EDD76_108144 [Kineothrix alysoides]
MKVILIMAGVGTAILLIIFTLLYLSFRNAGRCMKDSEELWNGR